MKTLSLVVAGAALALTLTGCAASSAPAGGDTYPGGTYTGAKTGCLVTDKEAMKDSDNST